MFPAAPPAEPCPSPPNKLAPPVLGVPPAPLWLEVVVVEEDVPVDLGCVEVPLPPVDAHGLGSGVVLVVP